MTKRVWVGGLISGAWERKTGGWIEGCVVGEQVHIYMAKLVRCRLIGVGKYVWTCMVRLLVSALAPRIYIPVVDQPCDCLDTPHFQHRSPLVWCLVLNGRMYM